jgi:hypothetical protein
MTELERALHELAADVAWPPAPAPRFRLDERPRASLLRPAAAVLALAVAALAIALAVPGARSALLHVLRIGGARIDLVQTLPRAREVPLAATLGQPVSRADARALLDAPIGLPAGARLYRSSTGVVSTLLQTPDGTALASELALFPAGILVKKVASERTRIESVTVARGVRGFWLTGGRHVVLEPTPARLAGNVLLWQVGHATYRLEGRRLRLATALALAREVAP